MNTLNVVESIFIAALERGIPEARAAYLDEACKGDADLRQCVERLLHAHAKAEKILPSQAPGLPATIAPPIEERPGSIIGPFKLLQQLGEGGFGVVFMAEQEQPVRRRVALKIIKPGMDSKQVVARFEAERQALAIMDHPNIARVLDGGTTESGRPYFVMELVKGIPITEFCDQNRLTPRERLELFIPVCQAVQHAHQKGIIHRDIKPSNVLVTMYDNKPVPKVIDFGVAKAIEQKLTEQTLFTRVGQIIGTLEYMSPEQASLNALDVDTRADVYALGVLLYELLTGTTPLNKERVKEVAFLELLRLIREEEPPRPSTRLSESGGALTAYAIERRSDSQKLPKLVQGELDWIAMKALEKDRTRRYESATDLAADVQRYLNDEQVQACPPTVLYRLQKNARKHKTLIGMVGTVAALLLFGIVGTSWGWTEALTQRDQAEQARHDEEEQRRLALADAAEAKINEKKAREAGEEARRLAKEESAARKQADAERLKALFEKQQGDLARHKIEWQLYASQISAAQREWEAGNVGHVDHYLRQCRPDLRGWEYDYLHHLAFHNQRTLRGHADNVARAVFSPDGKRIISVSNDGTVKHWKTASGEEIHTVKAKGTPCLAFSPDGKLLAMVLQSTVKLLDTSSGLEVRTINTANPKIFVASAAFSPDGKRLAIGMRSGTIHICEVASGENVTTLHPAFLGNKVNEVVRIDFSHDGKLLAAAYPGTVNLWDMEGGRELHTFKTGRFESSIYPCVAFSPDGKRLASVSKVWQVDSGQEVLTLKGAGSVMAYSPDGKHVAGRSNQAKGGVVHIWDAASGEEVFTFKGHQSGVSTVAFSPDGQRFVSASHDHTVKLWELKSRPKEVEILLPKEAMLVGKVAFTPDGSRVFHGSDAAVRFWDAATGKDLKSFRGSLVAIEDCAISPDGQRLAIAGMDIRQLGDGRVNLLDLASGKLTATLKSQTVVECVAFSKDGKRLATISFGSFGRKEPSAVRLWDAGSGEELHTFKGHKGEVNCLALSPDGTRLATGSESGEVRLWDTASGRMILDLSGHGGAVSHVLFTPDGSRLASSSWDRTVRLWDTANGKEVLTLKGHADAVLSLAMSPDGKRLASASRDKTVRLWDVGSGQEVLTFSKSAASVAFSPDGSRLALAGDDKVLVLDAPKAPGSNATEVPSAR